MSNNNNQSANVIIPKFKKFPPSTDGSDSIKNNIQIYPIPSTPFDDTLDHHVLADKSEDEFRNITTSNKIQEPLNTADAIALAERYELSVNVNTNKKRYPRKSAVSCYIKKEIYIYKFVYIYFLYLFYVFNTATIFCIHLSPHYYVIIG